MSRRTDATRLIAALAAQRQAEGPSSAKAREMLKDGTVHGRPLTKRQRRYFGAIVGRGR